MKNFHINKKVRETGSPEIKIYKQLLKTSSQLLIIGKMLACNLANTIYYGPCRSQWRQALGRKLGDWLAALPLIAFTLLLAPCH